MSDANVIAWCYCKKSERSVFFYYDAPRKANIQNIYQNSLHVV